MIGLSTGAVSSIAVVGAHCDDIPIGAGGTLLTLARANPGLTVHALVLTGGGTERENEERVALTAFCPGADVRLTVIDHPDGRLPSLWNETKERLANFRRTCDPQLVLAPQRNDWHQDHRLVAELIPTEFRRHLVLGYEILKWESDLPNPTVYHGISDSIANEKAELLHAHYPSQVGHDWFDHESFLGLMRLRGVQCRHRYAEAFVLEKAVIDLGETRVGHNET